MYSPRGASPLLARGGGEWVITLNFYKYKKFLLIYFTFPHLCK
nr:MAG TPA: hypothetical protein [Crassvirales sp.]